MPEDRAIPELRIQPGPSTGSELRVGSGPSTAPEEGARSRASAASSHPASLRGRAPRHVNLDGTITSITYPPAGSAPVVSAILACEGGSYVLRFLGRTDLHIGVGARLHVSGAVARSAGAPTIANPRYTVMSL